ncbi:hypothetical protein C4544_04095 [candidate division WS5 bacterium]|uniref:GIY-YIG catalytic domain-containing protein n=1 Tax=candidate division WS5 bacterium TaxID=2093353 RepID=A0A419DCY3_9BACT|nr:MAG: hypothetical protein C4544_04095 [candidate division WS5 bacterium]
MDMEKVIEELKRTRGPIGSHSFPKRSGIYALFLKKGSDLKEYSVTGDGLIYIGSTDNLSERAQENHFNSDSTGFSTIRRTLGAIMKEDFDLKTIPRSPGPSETNYKNYKFIAVGEKLLTDWMRNNLEIGYCPIFEDYEKIEKKMLKFLCPILNLKGCDNPYKKQIMALRKICSEEAKRNRAV